MKRFKFDYSLRYAIIITMSVQDAMSRQIQKRIVIMKKNSEYKNKKASKRYLDGEKVKQIARSMKISTSTIYLWIRQYNEKRNNIANEVTELRKLAERQQKMIEILKTVDCTVSAPLKEKLSAMEKLYGKYNNHLLCETKERRIISQENKQ